MASKNSMNSKKEASRQNVRVICRIRPTNQKELASGGFTCVKYSTASIEVTHEGSQNNYNFDRVFGAESTQVQVFEESARPLIADVLGGYNATIFAYGQTGTGKTHTMEGDITSDTDKGIIPRAVEALFDGVTEADETIEFTFKVSYVEIYLEKIRDLLDENRLKNNLAIREDKLKGVYIAGVTEEYVTSVDELLQIMHLGATNRAVAATGMNEGSSRSHSVFTITVGQRDVSNNSMKCGKLVLVDLAGSEMVRKTNASGQQLEEAKMINKSLSALGQVINALTDEKATHIPYRDSKLTRILQDSLGGNSKTVLIVAVSPSSYNASETNSTLRFGYRAKSIENKVTVNQTRSVEELENLLMRAEKAIDAQTAHIISLTTQLQAIQSGGVVAPMIMNNASNNNNNNNNNAPQDPNKVLVDKATLEAESQALKKLQEDLTALSQELEDEKQDSLRKDSELRELMNLLKDKERIIQDMTVVVTDVNKQNEGLKERCEQLLQEAVNAVGELASTKASIQDEIGKSKYQTQELEVTLQTLQAENQQLRAEIAELSGDSTDVKSMHKTSSTVSNKSKNVVTETVAPAIDDDELSFLPASSGMRRTTTSRAPNNNNNNGNIGMAADDLSLKPLSAQNAQELIDTFSTQFAAICLKFAVDEEISAELFGVFDGFSSQSERLVQLLEEKYTQQEKLNHRRIRDLEDHRGRLEKDLQNRIQNIVDLQMKFDMLSRMDNRQLADTIAERERARQRSLQQRLEQLVAVHRQLLRKFASLELENSELKKKSQLRDERIKQLENSTRGLIGNVRQQAEKYMADLATLREQLQVMKNEQDQRLDILTNLPVTASSPNTGKGNITRGSAPQKSVRGGGGAGGGKVFFPASSTEMLAATRSIEIAADKEESNVSPMISPVSTTSNSSGNRNSGMFSRLLGQRN